MVHRMKALRAVLLIAGILGLGVLEIAVWCDATGHSFFHVASLGIVPDEPRRPF